tara:strand:+ start:1309 stop:1767 length:459 start_codon:yes stop_codon:yes gene_type:complete
MLENLTNDQKSEITRIFTTILGEVIGHLAYINKMFCDDQQGFKIMNVNEYTDQANVWLQCLEERFLERLMESPFVPFTQFNEETEMHQEVTEDNLKGYTHMVVTLVMATLDAHVEDIGMDTIQKRIEEMMEADAEEVMSDKELKERTLKQTN